MSRTGKINQIEGEVEIEWKITDFLSPSKIDEKFDSPTFNMFEASWCLVCYPNGRSNEDSLGWIGLYLYREDSGPPVSTKYTFGLKTTEDKKKKLTHTISRVFQKCAGYGFPKAIRRSDVLDEKFELVPFGVLTITCDLKRCLSNILAIEEKTDKEENNSCVEASKQTEAELDTGSEVQLPANVNKLLHNYKELFLSEEYSDVTILVKSQQFHAHRNILNARSSVFASMLRIDMKEKATGVIEIEDCDPTTFPDFLHYLYCGSVEKLDDNNVFSLYATADKYDVQDLKSQCLNFIKKHLSIDTFCDTVTLCLRHSEIDLLKLATEFFDDNMYNIIVTVKWQAFIAENPIQCNELFIKALSSHKKSESTD